MELESGFPSGTTFTIGDHDILYRVSDACGNEQICSLKLRVRGPEPVITCVDDITVNATSAAGAIVTYNMPTVTTPSGGTCSYGNFFQASISNPVSGSQFPIGTTEVTYFSNRSGASDLCDYLPNFVTCSFTVTVEDLSLIHISEPTRPY